MYNVYGVLCSTYDEACRVAGIDTPAQLEAEDRYYAAEEAIAYQDRLEARGPTFKMFSASFDDIPF